VGGRPVTADGLPLVGCDPRSWRVRPTATACGGTIESPATGMLLARRIVTGKTPAPPRASGPLR